MQQSFLNGLLPLLLLSSISLITACMEDGATAAGSESQTRSIAASVNILVSWDELEVAKAIYTDQRLPSGFYSEESPDDSYYTITNVKNTDLLAYGDRKNIPIFELATNDYSQALNWSESAAMQMPIYKQLVDTSETEFYYQFTRVNINNPKFVHLSRVLKMSFIDRSSIDLANDSQFHGTIQQSPLSADYVKMAVEYFWIFSFSNNYGHVVVSSRIEETDVDFQYILVEAQLSRSSGDACDSIQIFETIYSVSKDTGDLYSSRGNSTEIFAKQDHNGITICG